MEGSLKQKYRDRLATIIGVLIYREVLIVHMVTPVSQSGIHSERHLINSNILHGLTEHPIFAQVGRELVQYFLKTMALVPVVKAVRLILATLLTQARVTNGSMKLT